MADLIPTRQPCPCGEPGAVLFTPEGEFLCDACAEAKEDDEPYGRDRVKRAGTPAITLIFQTVPDVEAMQHRLLDEDAAAYRALERAVWRRLAASLGLPRFTTHQVRHTSATVLSSAEVDDLVIADHLGHHGLATIQNYAQVTRGRRQRVLDIFEDLVAPDPPEEKIVPLRKPLRKRRRRRRGADEAGGAADRTP